ncbi:uncharacterized protein LOC115345892 [Aquila chrysaetos chrysaetos]|uniref:uncharacterized protein LOC115345892 n=1 Tax=Aquila chrysaetos chrysaetos TaxID=223781 RepID=UPI0011772E56|nr:uncharacterized protein LOC115345892 [Aquila chrysaetos chrysaetos]
MNRGKRSSSQGPSSDVLGRFCFPVWKESTQPSSGKEQLPPAGSCKPYSRDVVRICSDADLSAVDLCPAGRGSEDTAPRREPGSCPKSVWPRGFFTLLKLSTETGLLEQSQRENPPSATWPLFCLPGSFAVTCDTAGNVAQTWGGDTSDYVLSAPVPPADPSLDRLTSSHTHIQPLTSAVSQKQRRKTLVGCDSPFIVNSRRHTRTAIDGAREPRPAQCKPTRAQ